MTGNDNQPTASLFERCVTRRKMLLTGGGALAGILLAGCAGGEEQQQEQAEVQNKAYFGWLLTETSNIAAVAFDVAPPDAEGMRDVRAYVCDGLGPPDGMAVWFRGPMNEETVNQLEDMVSLTSPGG